MSRKQRRSTGFKTFKHKTRKLNIPEPANPGLIPNVEEDEGPPVGRVVHTHVDHHPHRADVVLDGGHGDDSDGNYRHEVLPLPAQQTRLLNVNGRQ